MYEVLDLVNDVPVIISSLDEETEATTAIFPNPAKNTLNITSYNTKVNSVEIYNLNGQLVLNKTLNTYLSQINISSLTSGIYIVDIKSENTTIKRKLIIE